MSRSKIAITIDEAPLNHLVISTVRDHYPQVEGIYLFGTFGTADERPDSDLDLALLLPPAVAMRQKNLAIGACRDDLEEHTGRVGDCVACPRISLNQ